MMPDPRAAVIAYLAQHPGVTALVQSTAISADPPAAGPPGYYLMVQWEPSLGAQPYTPEFVVGIGLRCYGPTRYEAGRLWRAVHHALEGDRQRVGFTAAGCRVKDIAFRSGPIDGDGPGEPPWPFVYVTYEARISEVAVA